MSGKSEFICKICKNVAKASFFGSGNRYKCPNHNFICKDCVTKGLLKSTRCKVCDSKVVTYSWDSTKSKWINS